MDHDDSYSQEDTDFRTEVYVNIQIFIILQSSIKITNV